ncbi:two-component system response regulator YesN [Paenibacillus endophyticus]|uniref:Two-component system response regulator YesN n=1 Tax=Paenibacillus endophyticus TaxID=1294268 RepID=A0A7W5CAY4_9BACL|nr:response regulator [Paenibacillus endophyticus]MBB3154370.1 two-component system response regulator YesN [Paenibacillus endophyticus]
MYRVLLVDDEKIARIGLRTTFDWERHGFILVGEASNGQNAMKWIQNQEIDILITDIAMPVMDGLELTRKTKELCPWVKVLLLSCHNDFEYVREGIRLGASDYILKPTLNSDSLITVLNQMKKKLQEESENRQIVQQFEDQQLANKLKMLEKTFCKALCGDLAAIERIKTECPEESYRIAALGINVFGKTDAERNDLLMEMGEPLKQVLYQVFGSFVSVMLRSDLLLAALPVHPNLHVMFYELIEQFSQHTQSHLLQVSIGLSVVYENYLDLQYASMEAEKMLAVDFFLGPCRLIAAEEQKDSISASFYPFAAALHELKESLTMGFHSRSEQMIIEIMKHWLPQYRSKEEVLQEAEELLSLFAVFKDADSSIIRKIRELGRLGYVTEVIQHVKDGYQTIVGGEDSPRPDKTLHQRIIMEAADYIKSHYRESISLQEVADAVNVSRNYFSEMFKRVTGENFIDHLIALRVKKAKELLQGSSLKVYEVAEQSGFNDVKYFSKQFKKIVGVSPAEFQGLLRK